MTRRDDIAERAAKATPGPWEWHGPWRQPHPNGESVRHRATLKASSVLIEGVITTFPKAVLSHESWAGPVEPADAAFIADVRTDIPWLLERWGEAITALLGVQEGRMADGSPCWCVPPQTNGHTVWCDAARKAFDEYRRG